VSREQGLQDPHVSLNARWLLEAEREGGREGGRGERDIHRESARERERERLGIMRNDRLLS
jgi:hypothetical protein